MSISYPFVNEKLTFFGWKYLVKSVSTFFLNCGPLCRPWMFIFVSQHLLRILYSFTTDVSVTCFAGMVLGSCYTVEEADLVLAFMEVIQVLLFLMEFVRS